MSNVTGSGVLLVVTNANVSAAKGGAGWTPNDGKVNVFPATIGVAQGVHGVVEITQIGSTSKFALRTVPLVGLGLSGTGAALSAESIYKNVADGKAVPQSDIAGVVSDTAGATAGVLVLIGASGPILVAVTLVSIAGGGYQLYAMATGKTVELSGDGLIDGIYDQNGNVITASGQTIPSSEIYGVAGSTSSNIDLNTYVGASVNSKGEIFVTVISPNRTVAYKYTSEGEPIGTVTMTTDPVTGELHISDKPFTQPQHPSSQPTSSQPTTVYNSATALANTSNSAYYQIQAGDTVGSIAAKLGISRQEYETYLKSVYGPHADLNSLTAGGKLPVPDAVAQAQMGSGLIQHQGQAPSNMVAGVTVQQGQQGSINGTTVEYDKVRGWVEVGGAREVILSNAQWQQAILSEGGTGGIDIRGIAVDTVGGQHIRQGEQAFINGDRVEYRTGVGWVDPGNGEVVMSLTQWQDNLSQGQIANGGVQRLLSDPPSGSSATGTNTGTNTNTNTNTNTDSNTPTSALTPVNQTQVSYNGQTYTLGQDGIASRPLEGGPTGWLETRNADGTGTLSDANGQVVAQLRAGDRVTTTDSGQVVLYTRNEQGDAGRLSFGANGQLQSAEISVISGTTATITYYGGDGKVQGSVSRQYFDDGSSTTVINKGHGVVEQHVRDSDGQMVAKTITTTVTTGQGVNSSTLSYGPTGQLISASSTQGYEDGSSVTQTQYANGTTEKVTRDSDQQIYRREVTSTTGTVSTSSTYDGAGSLLSRSTRQSFDDGTSSVTIEDSTGKVQTLAYGADGQLMAQQTLGDQAWAQFNNLADTGVLDYTLLGTASNLGGAANSIGQAEYTHGGDQKLHGGTPDVILGCQAYLTGEAAGTSNRKTIAMRTNADVKASAITQGKAGTTLTGSAAGQGLGATVTLDSSALVSKPIAFIPNGESQSRDVTAGMILSLGWSVCG